MIRVTQGNLLEADAEALVNTVNEVGVMGKGIALAFKEAFPDAAREYEAACKRQEVNVGKVLAVPTGKLRGPRWVVHFPTKKHWRNPSKLEWVRDGLVDLVRVIKEEQIRSIALPPLGCGSGKLDWHQVKVLIEQALGSLANVDVQVFEPTEQYYTTPKTSGLTGLTAARALIVAMIREYSILDCGCTNLEVQKLAWFLQRCAGALGRESPLKLEFKAALYGPYSDDLRHLLDNLDGTYLSSSKRVADAGPMDPIEVAPEGMERVRAFLEIEEGQVHQPVLELASRVIDGFQTPFALELLATVDWLMTEEGCAPTAEELLDGLKRWKRWRDRKLRLFDGRSLEVAARHLSEVFSVVR